MILNYLKITLRNLFKNTGYSLINILGLAIGLACFSIIFIYLQNELSYDRFNTRLDRAYRVVGILDEPGLGEYHNAITAGPLAPALVSELPDIEQSARLMSARSSFVSRGDKGFYEDDIAYADPGLLDILSVTVKAGPRASLLKEPYTIIIDEDIAHKYFGDENPVGRQLTISTGGGTDPYTVGGVMTNYPKNSHVGFSILISFVTAEPAVPYLKMWNTNCLTTYALLKPGVAKERVDPQISSLVNRQVKDDSNSKRFYYLQPLSEIHLYSGHILYQMNRNGGNAGMLRMFGIIGVFVLLIASINYMNLATARSVQRAKEVGMRKVLGSGKRDLVVRFIGESTVTALFAYLLSLVIVELIFPSFLSIMASPLALDVHHQPLFLLELAGVAFIVGVGSGVYPAFILSSYSPADTLRGKYTRGKGGATLRKGLVFAQFSIAIILLACTGIVRDQMEYVRTKDVGFDKSQLMYVSLRSNTARAKYLLMKDELLRNSTVNAVTGGEGMAGAGGSDGTMIVAGTNKQSTLMMRFSPVDYDFCSTLNLHVVQGRDFSREISSDSANGVMINEAAARELGWKDAVGKQFEQSSGPPLNVIGVVKDYHYFSLYTKIEPQILYIRRDLLRYLLVKIRPQQIEQGIADVENTWKQHLPAEPFDYGFVDQAFDQRYRAGRNTQQLFSAFSLVAVLVGCLGLLGLSAFTAEQRTKEIGIRKTLGATTSSIVIKLSMEFVKFVALACIVAFPIAYWAMQGWLQNFAYRTSVSPLSFIEAGLVVVCIAFLTVSIQAMKVALANPIDALRYE